MIVQIRVDEKLIHGQVVTNWIAPLGSTHVICANDKATTDKIQQMSLKMTVPTSVKFSILTVAKTTELCSDPRSKDFKIFIVVNTPQDAYAIASGVPAGTVKEINLASYGNFMKSDVKNKKQVATQVKLDDDDYATVKAIQALNLPSFMSAPILAKTPKNLQNV